MAYCNFLMVFTSSNCHCCCTATWNFITNIPETPGVLVRQKPSNWNLARDSFPPLVGPDEHLYLYLPYGLLEHIICFLLWHATAPAWKLSTRCIFLTCKLFDNVIVLSLYHNWCVIRCRKELVRMFRNVIMEREGGGQWLTDSIE